MNNAIDSLTKTSMIIEAGKVDDIANRLVKVFHSPGSREFYCKVAYALPEDRIFFLANQAKEKGRDTGGGLFNYLVRNDMKIATGKATLHAMKARF